MCRLHCRHPRPPTSTGRPFGTGCGPGHGREEGSGAKYSLSKSTSPLGEYPDRPRDRGVGTEPPLPLSSFHDPGVRETFRWETVVAIDGGFHHTPHPFVPGRNRGDERWDRNGNRRFRPGVGEPKTGSEPRVTGQEGRGRDGPSREVLSDVDRCLGSPGPRGGSCGGRGPGGSKLLVDADRDLNRSALVLLALAAPVVLLLLNVA